MLAQTNKNWESIQDKDILAQLAIEAALNFDWEQAQKINKKILTIVKNDIESLNRLAHAYTCSNQRENAQKIYKQVLALDPYNLIAAKNLEKISKLNGFVANNNQSNGTDLSQIFLYEPGKTKIISLLNLAPPSVLSALNCGQTVTLNAKRHSVTISTEEGTYLGSLPDDLAHRLIGFISGGNQYESYIKYSTPKSLTVFIREVLRSSKFTNQPSFADNRTYFDEKE